jgi:hypothetical protein
MAAGSGGLDQRVAPLSESAQFVEVDVASHVLEPAFEALPEHPYNYLDLTHRLTDRTGAGYNRFGNPPNVDVA